MSGKVAIKVHAISAEFADGAELEQRPVFLNATDAQACAEAMGKATNIKMCQSWLATITVDEEEAKLYK